LLFLQTYDFPVEILELFGPLALYFFLEPRALALLN
jgi:hypothetical protein